MTQYMPELSIILPCLNEEAAIGACLTKIKNVVRENNINAEIIVVDNDSSDKSCQIALENEVKVVKESRIG